MGLMQFGEELRQARQLKGISLIDIASETRINQKFLEAIERGEFQILPQTYVRAFLREFAMMVDLDPMDVMHKYDEAKRDIPAKQSDEPIQQKTTIQDNKPLPEPQKSGWTFSAVQRNSMLVGIFILALTLIYVFVQDSKGISSATVTELPFDHVIKENEALTLPATTTLPDSTPSIIIPKTDSLRLDMVTTDSVWISLLIDSKKAEDHLIGVNKKRTWMAKERFAVTMGNAGGATFRLNGKDIGALGKRGAVIRNTVITNAMLNN